MKYENLTRFNDGEFKRLVGVPRPLFLKMISVLQQAELAKKKSRRPHSLYLADQLLLTLNYLRCYIAKSLKIYPIVPIVISF